MDSALTKLALTALAVLVVVGLLAAIAFSWAAYSFWVRRKRGPEEADATLTGDSCASCSLSETGCEMRRPGIVQDED